MKTYFKKYIVLLIAALPLFSCDSWLDIEPKGKIILKTAAEYGQLFDNPTYIKYTSNDIEYLDDERWVNGQVLINGWNSMNLGVANIIYKTDYDRSVNAMGNAGNGSTLFQRCYERITKIANTIILAESTMTGSEQEIQELIAQAKFYRAFNYFVLINTYAKPYDAATADSDGGVPLRTDAFVEVKPELAKSTVSQIYAQIETDIEEAINDLPAVAVTKFRFNKAAGYAFKAKVHLFKKEWDQCIEAATESNRLCKETSDLVELVDAATNKPKIPIYASADENLFFATAETEYFLIHTDLINLFKKGLSAYGQTVGVYDVRFDLYKAPLPSFKDYEYTTQYMPKAKEYSTNSIGFRTTEVMLMMAESYARKGKYDSVKESLKEYFVSRYRNYDHTKLTIPNNVKDAVKMVIDERRKELTMGFNRFFDLRRLNTETDYQIIPTRTIPGDPKATPGVPQNTYRLAVKSPLYILPFPEKVLLNDPRLTSNQW